MFIKHNLLKIFFFLFIINKEEYCVNANVIRGLFEAATNSLFGMPVIHKKTEWDFHPDLGQKYRSSFYEEHGYRAANYVQQIGLGQDGNEHLRIQEQAIRDKGRLNGEHFINFP